MERILCSAIHFDDGKEHIHQPKNINIGIVVCGRRHHNCYAIAALIPDHENWKGHSIQGFLTNTDRFVDRKEAFEIAKAANQLLIPDESDKKDQALISEDLW